MRVLRCDRGVAAVEFAMIGLILIVFAVGAFEFARALYVKHHISDLADDAARSMLLDSSISDAAVQSSVGSAFLAGDSADLTVTLTQETHNGTNYRVISVSYPVTLLIPDIAPGGITISVQRRVPIL